MLEEHEQREAAAQGWHLCTVYDAATERAALAVLPLSFEKSSAEQVQRMVIEMAKHHNRLAIKALTLVAQSHIPKPTRKKK